MFLLFIFAFADVTIHAQTKPEAAKKPYPTATAWTKGSVSSLRKMFAPGTPVKILGKKEEQERDKDAGFVPPRERNAIFRKVGIEAKVAKMDEFDKDILVMSAQEYNLRSLKAEYPAFSETQLRKLKEEVVRFK